MEVNSDDVIVLIDGKPVAMETQTTKDEAEQIIHSEDNSIDIEEVYPPDNLKTKKVLQNAESLVNSGLREALQRASRAIIANPSCSLSPCQRKVYVDMDGVIVDFDAYMQAHGISADIVKRKPGAYFDMTPLPGALDAVKELITLGFDVWIATKPPTGVPHAYSDKVKWILKYLPELEKKIIITHDKGTLGDSYDFLCDDRPHKANCEAFKGTLVRFTDGYHWPEAMEYFRHVARTGASITVAHD
ncbi:5' nucleotidase, NT5C type [Neptuniibacter sp. QD37_11]|uniref:5' nucleotidase, NT5C type n=1 Tax=Neptuniibacter sp. QD37_11 TaxID=3398209 RepID=UPI0039F56C9B